MMHGAWPHNGLIWGGIALAACVALLLAALAIWLKFTANERRTRRTLANIADRVLRDVAVPDGMGGWVVIDAIMLRGHQLHVLDLRDVEGAIFGAEKMDQWTIIGKRWRSQFQNPLRFMQDRVLAVRSLLPGASISGYVLFSARAQFPKGRPDGVQLLEEFAQPLLRSKPKPPIALDTEATQLWQQFCAATEIVSNRQPQKPGATA